MLYFFLVIVLFYVLASQYAVNKQACPQCVGYADLAAKYGCGCKQEEYIIPSNGDASIEDVLLTTAIQLVDDDIANGEYGEESRLTMQENYFKWLSKLASNASELAHK